MHVNTEGLEFETAISLYRNTIHQQIYFNVKQQILGNMCWCPVLQTLQSVWGYQ